MYVFALFVQQLLASHLIEDGGRESLLAGVTLTQGFQGSRMPQRGVTLGAETEPGPLKASPTSESSHLHILFYPPLEGL